MGAPQDPSSPDERHLPEVDLRSGAQGPHGLLVVVVPQREVDLGARTLQQRKQPGQLAGIGTTLPGSELQLDIVHQIPGVHDHRRMGPVQQPPKEPEGGAGGVRQVEQPPLGQLGKKETPSGTHRPHHRVVDHAQLLPGSFPDRFPRCPRNPIFREALRHLAAAGSPLCHVLTALKKHRTLLLL